MSSDRSTGPFARLRFEILRRLLPHGLILFVVWPVVSVLFGAVTLLENPVAAGVPFSKLTAGTAGGAARMLPEFAVGALLLFATCVLVFAVVAVADGARGGNTSSRPQKIVVEPVLFFLTASLGVILEYPAVLRHPLFILLRPLSVRAALVTLAIAALGFSAVLARQQGGIRRVLRLLPAVALVTLVSWRLSRPVSVASTTRASAHSTVLLGLDSISQTDDVAILRDATRRFGGTWYEKPVPPGLLTNSVWPAILMSRPAHETGMIMVFQKTNWSRAPFNVVRRAQEKGCETFAYLETGFTAYMGRAAGFDVDRSGPQGWLQPATAAVKDGSVLLPVVLARLPYLPGAITPPNQTGAFNYDVRREIREILTRSGRTSCSFVAAHLDYLHQTCFPSFTELNPEERRAIYRAHAGALHDLSLEWQFPVMIEDPLKLYAWKIHHIQTVLAQEIASTGFLDPRNDNRLIVFSDHGNRRAINDENFGLQNYHQVILATFRVPARDPNVPVSLLDIPAMLGLGDPRRPERADPVVEYTNVTGEEWQRLMKSAQLRSDGEISLDPAIVRGVGARLRGFRPYSPRADYFPVPVSEPSGSR